MRLEQQLDDIFHQPGDAPGTSRRKHFGSKPKLWDTWVKLGEEERSSSNELSAIKVRCISRSPSLTNLIFIIMILQPLAVVYVPQETNKPKDPSSSPPVPQPEQERRQERSSAFLASLFAHPLALPRHLPPENNRPGSDSANSSSEISRIAQVSVVISMPSPTRRTPPVSNSTREEFPNVAIGLTRLRIANE